MTSRVEIGDFPADQDDFFPKTLGILYARHAEITAEIILTEPVLGSVPERVHPASIGGTRHLAAAQFVHDQHAAVALVASQDGNFTVFRWSEALQVVHAHRIDVLLL